MGIYTGYQGSEANLASGSETEADSAKFGVYGTHGLGQGTWLTGAVGGGVHAYDTTRRVLGTDVEGDTDGREISAQFGLGHDFQAGRWTFGPEAELAYTRLWIDGFTERGGLGPLEIQDQDADSLRSTLGARVSCDWVWENTGWTLRPYAHAGWRHEFMHDNQAIGARFAGGSGSVFEVEGASSARDSVVAGAGLGVAFDPRWTLQAGYAAEAAGDYEIHQVNASVSFRF